MKSVGILIGSTVAILLLAGIFETYLLQKSHYKKLHSGIINLKNQQLAVNHLLQQNLKLTGFRAAPNNAKYQSMSTIFPNGYLQGSDNTGENGSDSISFSYQGSVDNNVYDCTGIVVAANTTAFNTLNINNNNLVCNNTIIVDGVENLQVLYGVDSDQDKSVNYYTTADNANMQQVIALRLAFLLSGATGSKNTNANKTYNLLGTQITTTDNKLRQVFNSTIQLRSLP